MYKHFVLLLLFFSCQQDKIEKVVLASSGIGCEVECPYEVFSIEKNGKLKYFGKKYTDSLGYFVGNISPEIWDSIEKKFSKISIKGLDTIKGQRTDHSFIELYISKGNKEYKKTINSGKLSDENSKIILWFSRLVKRAKIVRTIDTLTFETTTQNFEIPEVKALK